MPKINKQINAKKEGWKINSYLTSLEIVNACLLHEENKHNEALKVIENVENGLAQSISKLGDKNIKQLHLCRIQCLTSL